MAEKAFITPNVLKWARESARITEEIAAARVSVSVERLRDWEAGYQQPTIRQAQTLAKAYKRPFALFFLPEVPRDFQPLQDFRKSGSKELSTSSIFIIREIQQKQAWISDVYSDNNAEKLPFIGKFNINDDPQTVANDILETLGIHPPHYMTDNIMKEWVNAAERNGIFVSRSSFIHTRMKLDSEELQGFAIADPFAPFVFVNSDDWNAPQLFTLVHELAHLWIAASGISNGIEPDIDNRIKFNAIELFCNEVAANALIPNKLILNLDRSLFKKSPEVYKTARNLGVSSLALLVRAYNLQMITTHEYNELKKQAKLEYQLFLKKLVEKKSCTKIKAKGKTWRPKLLFVTFMR